MHPATLHGTSVITKLYFVMSAAFNESMTLNLAQLSFKVIHFCSNRKRACTVLYRQAYIIVTFALSTNVSEILPRFCTPRAIFSYSARSIPAKIWSCSLWSRSVMFGSAERGKARLISREIIFQRIPTYVTTVPQRHGQSDRRLAIAIPRSAYSIVP